MLLCMFSANKPKSITFNMLITYAVRLYIKTSYVFNHRDLDLWPVTLIWLCNIAYYQMYLQTKFGKIASMHLSNRGKTVIKITTFAPCDLDLWPTTFIFCVQNIVFCWTYIQNLVRLSALVTEILTKTWEKEKKTETMEKNQSGGTRG